MMKRFHRALPVLALALGVSACDEGLTEINENPNAPEVVPAENLLAGAIRNAAAGSSQYGVFGYWNQFYHSELWVQHVAQSAYNDEDRYTPRAGVNENIWIALYDAQNDFERTKDLAVEQGNDNLWAVAEIMSVYTWQVMTDLFGDIPYSEAVRLDEDITHPKFDSQEAIYTDLLARLKAVDAKITPSANVLFDDGDLVYEGNMQNWLEFSNALTLRVAMRIADTSKSGDARAAFVEAWAQDKFDDNSDNASLEWAPSQPGVSPVNQLIVLSGRQGDFRVSQALVDTLSHLNDPRLEVYAEPAASDGEFRGLPNGVDPAALDMGISDFSTIGESFIEADASSFLMTYAEQQLLGAEAAQRGWLTVSAATLYNQGVTAAQTMYGISDADAAAYLAQPRVAYAGGTAGLTQIYLQKWLHLFAMGAEAWSEWRRTGVPNLVPSAEAVIDQIPVRIEYPDAEGQYNPENFEPYAPLGIEEPIWWMQ